MSPTELRILLRRNGYDPLPCEGKIPPLTDWPNKRGQTDAEIGFWEKMYPLATNTGVLSRDTPGIDIDISDEDAAQAVEELARRYFEEPRGDTFLVRTGRAPRRLVPLRTNEPFPKLKVTLTAPNGEKQEIEILADGEQWIAYGNHATTGKPYMWFGGQLETTKRDDLPYVRQDDMHRFLDEATKLLVEQFEYKVVTNRNTNGGNGATGGKSNKGGGEPVSIVRVANALARIADDGGDYHAWLHVALATFAATNGSAEGFVEFDKWSQRSPKYDAKGCAKKWADLHRSPPKQITAGTLFFLAREATHKAEPEERQDFAPPFSDEALALLFAERHAEDFHFVPDFGHWITWTGTHWRRDRTIHAFDLARAIAREQAVLANSADKPKNIASGKTVAAVEKLARADRRIVLPGDIFDADPDVINCAGHVVDLRTGEARPVERNDWCMKSAAVAPAETAHCPLWIAFLNRIMANRGELIDFLQRWCGYSLTGYVSEEVLAFLFGGGANGKTVFIETVRYIIGDYGQTAPMDMFMETQNDRHPTEIARLNGRRLVTANETTRGRHWDEAKIKNLTGGDTLTARFMRQNFFEFPPTHKLMLAGNNQPGLKSVGEAIRRRLALVPFEVTIPPEERDTKLKNKLRKEAPAILRWMIEGAMAWYEHGLQIPAAVQSASEEYIADQDHIAQWIEERIKFVPNAFTSTNDLFNDWVSWCSANTVEPGKKNAFSAELRSRGWRRPDDTSKRGFKDVRLTDPPQKDFGLDANA